jgi:hypothetical protein
VKRLTVKEQSARQLRWGQLITSLELADVTLRLGRRALDLMTPEDRRLFDHAMSLVIGLQQRAWIAQALDLSSPRPDRPVRKRRKP